MHSGRSHAFGQDLINGLFIANYSLCFLFLKMLGYRPTYLGRPLRCGVEAVVAVAASPAVSSSSVFDDAKKLMKPMNTVLFLCLFVHCSSRKILGVQKKVTAKYD